jgi:hypothetical protein
VLALVDGAVIYSGDLPGLEAAALDGRLEEGGS